MRLTIFGVAVLAAASALGAEYITSVRLPDGTTKTFQDKEARQDIQEILSQKYLRPESVKAGANVSVTTNAAGEVTIAAVAPAPANYTAVSNRAMNAASRAELEAGWWSEWEVLRDGVDVTAQLRPPSWIPEGTIGPAYTKVWFVGNSCISGDEPTSGFLVDGPQTEYVGDLSWSAEDAVGESVSYTATRHRVAAPVPTKPSDIGAQSVNPLAGNEYDFSTNADVYRAVKDIVEALGGSVTNFPAIPELGEKQN